MRILIQRVSEASVEVDEKKVGAIGLGMLIFIGVTQDDTKENAVWLAKKCTTLRVFCDEEGKLNRSILEVNGEVLVVSQFTLYGDCMEGRRPSFTKAALPEQARVLYETFIQEIKNLGVAVQAGVFGAKMKVGIVNEGPLTFLIEK